MKYFILILTLMIVSCGQKHEIKFYKLKTNDTVTQNNFNKCLAYTDSVIIGAMGLSNFEKYFKLRSAFFNFQYYSANLFDTIPVKPRGYMIIYDFIFEGDTIDSYRLDFDSTARMCSENYYKKSFTAYQKFIDKELSIKTSDALLIAEKEGIKIYDADFYNEDCRFKTNEYEFQGTRPDYYWEIHSDCNHCLCIIIDAKDGRIADTFYTMWQKDYFR